MNLQMFTLSEVLPSPPTKGKAVKGLEKLKGIAFNMISKYFFNNIFPFFASYAHSVFRFYDWCNHYCVRK